MGFDAYKENGENDVTVSLTKDSMIYKSPYRNQSKKWTVYLIFCCLTVAMASFQFGYNISSLNKPSSLIKEFIKKNFFLFREYNEKYELFHLSEGWLNGNATKLYNGQLDYDTKKSEYISCKLYDDQDCVKRMEMDSKKKNDEYKKQYNMTLDQFFVCANAKIANGRIELESKRILLNNATNLVDKYTAYLWTAVNCLFVLGGMYGAYKSKRMLDFFGRKNAILVHYLFTMVGSIMVFISPAIKSPICLGFSRFLFGIQGAMSCSLVPIYLNEISPSSLRGQIGVIPQTGITLGILVGQLFGFDQILGSSDLWNYLLAIPILPALVGFLLLLIFFPETPKALLIKYKDCAAREALERLRHTSNITTELDEIKKELATNFKICHECHQSAENSQSVSICNLITSKEYRWQLITAVVLHVCQQFSGINAIFFYSSDIFKSAGIADDHIQYAIFLTGFVNLMTTFACIPLIDRWGRKPLLIIPMITIIVNYILLTLFLTLKQYILSDIVKVSFSYCSVICIIIFIIFYAIGLGPIPFIYSAEVFPQNARTSGMAISVFSNWTAALVLTFLFPLLQSYLKQYVFLTFILIILPVLIIVLTKMPETKGKTIEQINEKFRVTKFLVLQNNLSPGVAV